jgi:hypothetical protein
MIVVFLDASALFSASYSKMGSARDLLREAIRGNLKIVVSQHVLATDETPATAAPLVPQGWRFACAGITDCAEQH